MAILVVEFPREGYKIRKFFWIKINIGTQRKLLNFENWSNDELLKNWVSF